VESDFIRYGLLAVFLASLLEADVVPVLAGVAAHRGYFNPWFGIIVASGGALTGDCFWYFLGQEIIQNSKMVLRLRTKAEDLFHRVGMWQIPASHVVYGTRIATMTWLGARGSAFGSFAVVDGLSCFVLTTFLLFLGFALSASAQIILVHVRRIEMALLMTLILLGLSFHLLRKFRRTNPQLSHQPGTALVTDCAVTGERKT